MSVFSAQDAESSPIGLTGWLLANVEEAWMGLYRALTVCSEPGREALVGIWLQSRVSRLGMLSCLPFC